MRLIAIAAAVVLLGLVLFLGHAVIRLESYRYANFLGHCEKFDLRNAQQRLARENCLYTSVTPRYWFMHLLHGTRLL
jgi:hypothetical protein